MRYSDLIGNYNNGYHTYGNWSDGGTIYLETIYGAEYDAKCGYHSNGSVGPGGHTSSTKITIQERADYTAWLYQKQFDYWEQIFGDFGTISQGGEGNYNTTATGTGYTGEYTSSSGITYRAYKQYIYKDVYGETSERAAWLKKAGCGLTSAAIIISAYDTNVTPVTLYDNYRSREGSVNIQKYLTVSNIKYEHVYSYDKQRLKEWLANGNSAIVCLPGNATINGESWAGSSGHYITFLDINSNNEVYVSNPGANDSHKNGNYNIDLFDGKIAHLYYIEADGAKKSVNGNISNKMAQLVNEAIRICNDNRYTYSQENRYSEFQYDCSSFVYRLHKQFFPEVVDVPTTTREYGSKYQIASSVNIPTLRPGDVLWRSGHVALYIGNGKIAEASSGNVPREDQILISDLAAIQSTGRYAFTKVYRFAE